MNLDLKLILAGALFTIILIYGLAYLLTDKIAKDSLNKIERLDGEIEKCINSSEAEKYLERIKREAMDLNIQGTPSFVINEETIRGNREIIVFTNALDSPIGDPKKNLYSKDDIAFGNPNSSVWMIEFSSPLCIYCQKYHAEKFDYIYKQYISTGKVFYIFKGYSIFNRVEEKELIKSIYCVYKLKPDYAIEFINKVFKK